MCSEQQLAARGLEEPVPSAHSAAERHPAQLCGPEDRQQGEEAPDQLPADGAGRVETHDGPRRQPEVAQWQAGRTACGGGCWRDYVRGLTST